MIERSELTVGMAVYTVSTINTPRIVRMEITAITKREIKGVSGLVGPDDAYLETPVPICLAYWEPDRHRTLADAIAAAIGIVRFDTETARLELDAARGAMDGWAAFADAAGQPTLFEKPDEKKCIA